MPQGIQHIERVRAELKRASHEPVRSSVDLETVVHRFQLRGLSGDDLATAVLRDIAKWRRRGCFICAPDAFSPIGGDYYAFEEVADEVKARAAARGYRSKNDELRVLVRKIEERDRRIRGIEERWQQRAERAAGAPADTAEDGAPDHAPVLQHPRKIALLVPTGSSSVTGDSAAAAAAAATDRIAHSLAWRYVRQHDLDFRTDGEDLVQEGRVALFLALPTFRGESSFTTFAYAVMRNAMGKYVRDTAPPPVYLDGSEPDGTLAHSFEDRVIGYLDLVTALKAVPDADLLLRQQLGVQALSGSHTLSEGAIRTRRSRARQRLRQKLGRV